MYEGEGEEERTKIKTRQAEVIASAKAQGKTSWKHRNLSRLIRNGKQEKIQRLKQ